MIGDLLQASLRDEGVYDELSGNGLDPRPHWAPLIESLGSLGTDELVRRWGRAERRIRENGVSYNVYNDALGASRPWRLDLIPFLLPANEWEYIEVGITQRAQVLELLLADLYGPQELLREGRVPPELLFANPAFLRPVAGLKNPHGSFLHLIAVDLARSPDGQWWVLADRTQAPSGDVYKRQSLLRPALCVEVREGRLHIFMPYVLKASDYLELLAAVEDTCVHLNQPVWIEGYAPPSDSRLHNFSVTPDPGVIEVNLPPAGNWTELESINKLVFEEAQRCRLTAEKFMYDGRQTATGGGNHIVLGGATPCLLYTSR